jgi:hypothetical protein
LFSGFFGKGGFILLFFFGVVAKGFSIDEKDFAEDI